MPQKPRHVDQRSEVEQRLIAYGYAAYPARCAKYMRDEFARWLQQTADQPAATRRADLLDFAAQVLGAVQEIDGRLYAVLQEAIAQLDERRVESWREVERVMQSRRRGANRRPVPEPGSVAAGPVVTLVAPGTLKKRPQHRRKAAGG